MDLRCHSETHASQAISSAVGGMSPRLCLISYVAEDDLDPMLLPSSCSDYWDVPPCLVCEVLGTTQGSVQGKQAVYPPSCISSPTSDVLKAFPPMLTTVLPN